MKLFGKHILLIACLLTGCTKTYQEYTQLVKKCESIGGTPMIVTHKLSGRVATVQCKLDNNGPTFIEGEY